MASRLLSESTKRFPCRGRSSPRAVFAHNGVVVKDPARKDAHEDLAALVLQLLCEGGAVIAGVEDEQRHLPVGRQQPDEPTHLVDGRFGRAHLRVEAHHVSRRCPRVLCPVELADPLVAPSRHDRLAGRVVRGRVVKAAGTALGVTARPGGGVDREDERRPEKLEDPALGRRGRGEEIEGGARAGDAHRVSSERAEVLEELAETVDSRVVQWRYTRTGQWAWVTQCSLTEPRSIPANSPWPRLPTTRRSAPADASTRICAV